MNRAGLIVLVGAGAVSRAWGGVARAVTAPGAAPGAGRPAIAVVPAVRSAPGDRAQLCAHRGAGDAADREDLGAPGRRDAGPGILGPGLVSRGLAKLGTREPYTTTD